MVCLTLIAVIAGLSAAFMAFAAGGSSQVVFAADAPLRGEILEASETLELIREEKVSVASQYEQPISQAPSNVYVITDDDIKQSGAPNIPTILRCVPGVEVMQVTGAEFNVSVRGDNQLLANKLLVLVDGRSYLTRSGIRAGTSSIG